MSGLLLKLALTGLGRAALRLSAALAAACLLAAAFVPAALSAVLVAALQPERLSGAGAQVGGVARISQRAAERRTTVPKPAAGVPGGLAGVAPAGATGIALWAAVSATGTPYRWGGTDPRSGVDCSGLVQWAYRQAGLALPRTAQQQFDATAPVPRDALQAGDLVFFQICCQPPDVVTHVGIYVGTGQMLHAPAPGEYVRIESIDTPYWRSQWAGAGRVAVSTASSRPPRESTP